jgi:uncharacterized protein
MFAATGDDRFKRRAELMVAEMAACQGALGGGYLSAFPVAQIDALESGQREGVWAPYYTLHKILAGLLDAHRDAGNAQALDVAQRLGDWIVARLSRLAESDLDPLLRTSELNPHNEYGGIGLAIYELFQLTGKSEYLETARKFDRAWFLSPLMEGRDELAGLHANTHIPQILAAARRYEITGEAAYRRAALYFWERTALARSYANGGSSGPRPDRRERSEGGEHWPDAFRLDGTLTPKINESCVTHNMLRLTDTLFGWTADGKIADFRERAFFNSVLAIQHPHTCGAYLYSHPLSAGSRKVFGDFDQTFWCCYGTSIEAYARLTDGIYFTDGDSLLVTQFIASEIDWLDKGVCLTQQTNFPRDGTTTLAIQTDRPREFVLRIRIPHWAGRPAWRLNGTAQDYPGPTGDFLILGRAWTNGDRVEITFPMSLRIEPMPGDDTQISFHYGPTLLAARTPHGLELGLPASRAMQAVTTVDASRLQFSVRLGFGGAAPLVPVSEIVDEPFGVYFKTL